MELRPDGAAAGARSCPGHALERAMAWLRGHLRDGESVHRVTSGRYGPAIGLLAVTNQRVLLVRDGRGGHASEGFPLERLVNAAWADDGPTGTITISDANAVAVLRGVSPTDGADVLALIHHAIRQNAAHHGPLGGRATGYSARPTLRPALPQQPDTGRPPASAPVPSAGQSPADQRGQTHQSAASDSVSAPTLDLPETTTTIHRGEAETPATFSTASSAPAPDAPRGPGAQSSEPHSPAMLPGERPVTQLRTKQPPRHESATNHDAEPGAEPGAERAEPAAPTRARSKTPGWRRISPLPIPESGITQAGAGASNNRGRTNNDTITTSAADAAGCDKTAARPHNAGTARHNTSTNTPHDARFNGACGATSAENATVRPLGATPPGSASGSASSPTRRTRLTALGAGLAGLAVLGTATALAADSRTAPTRSAPTAATDQRTDPPAAMTATAVATVTRVVDPDTVEVTGPGVTGPVAVLGIVTPDMDSNQCGATAAQTYALRTLGNQPVTLVTDASQPPTDGQGRKQAFLRLADGGDYSTMAVRAGMARYRENPRPVATAHELKAAEQQARHDKVGLWDPQCDGKRIAATPRGGEHHTPHS